MQNARVMTVQMEVLPGRPLDNTARMLDFIRNARAEHADLVVFPEMAVPGYLIGDEWEHEAFLRECENCCLELEKASKGVICVFGSIGIDWRKKNEDGRIRKYNALFVAENGRFVGPSGSPYRFVIKTLLPNYREFDDSRHFYDLRKLAADEDKPLKDLVRPVRAGRFSLGCVLCEDAWDTDYSVSPLAALASQKADLFINISSSPFTVNKGRKRHRVFSAQASKLKRPFVYVNNVGIQNNGKTVFVFDGSSCIYDARGNVVPCGELFAESVKVVDVPLSPSARFGKPVSSKDDGIDIIYRALHSGTRRFMDTCGVRRVTVGLSGGIDSAVVACIYSRILPREDLLLVNMPGEFTSATTRRLARSVAETLGCYYVEIPIHDSVKLTRRQADGLTIASINGKLKSVLKLSPLMLENVQARDRSSRILAAASAAFGGVFTCNANKSEATVGYTTLYGDLSGYFANIADLWKMEIYDLADYMNREVFGKKVIPKGIMDLTPSAELSPDQDVDKGKGDPLFYPYHDTLFRSWVESWNRTTPEEILEWYSAGNLEKQLGYDGKVKDLFKTPRAFVEDLERWWNQYQGMGVAKRIQAPPVLAVKRRAFGFDHRESQMGPRYTKKYLLLRERLLARA